MPSYSSLEIDDMAVVAGWTNAQASTAVSGSGTTATGGHNTNDLLRALLTALANCLHDKAQQIRSNP